MKIQLGLRGSSDTFNHVIVKIDDLMLMNTENLFMSGQEYRTKTGRSLIGLLDALSKDHEISIGEKVAKEVESELHLEEGVLNKYADKEIDMRGEATEVFKMIESLVDSLTEEDTKILIESLVKEDNSDGA